MGVQKTQRDAWAVALAKEETFSARRPGSGDGVGVAGVRLKVRDGDHSPPRETSWGGRGLWGVTRENKKKHPPE